MLHLGHVESYHLVRQVPVSVLPRRHCLNPALADFYGIYVATGKLYALDKSESY